MQTLCVKPHALSTQDRVIGEITTGKSLGEICDLLAVSDEIRNDLIIQINGRTVPCSMWNTVYPKDAMRVDIFPQYHGGDSGKQVLAMAAMLALALIAPGIGVGLANAMVWGGSAALATGISAGVMLVGALAISALFAPPEQDVADIGQGQLMLSGQSNSARPDGGMMRVYGQIRTAPDVIALPYSIAHDGDEHLITIYSFGYGNTYFEDILVGPVHYVDLDEVQKYTKFNWVPADGFHFYPHDVHHENLDIRLINNLDTAGGIKQPPSDDWRVFRSEKETDSVILSVLYPEGVFLTLTQGGTDPIEVLTWVFYRALGSTTWINAGTLTNVLDSPKGRAAWAVSDGENGIRISYELAKTFLVQATFTMPSRGQYEFKVGRSQDPSARDKDIEENWHSQSHVRYLQSVTHEPPINPPVPISFLEFKVKATDQISGTVDNLTAIARSYIPYKAVIGGPWIIPVHSGTSAGTWSAPWTDNPAWIYLDILKGDSNEYPLTDDDIDIDAFDRWAAYCDTHSPDDPSKPFIACNFAHTGTETVNQILQKVAACGNASRAVKDGKQSIIWDAGSTYPVQLFTQRNTWGFQLSKNYIVQPHGIRVSFLDETDDYKKGEVIAYSPGYDANNATNFEDLEAFGCTEVDQAHRSGLRYLAMGRYRSETFSFSCDIENLACERGDRIRISYSSVEEGGITGRIKELMRDATGAVTSIKLDEKHGSPTLSNHGALIRAIDSVAGPATPHIYIERVSNLPDDYTLEFATPIHAITLDLVIGDLVVFGEMQEITEDYLVTSIVPGQDLAAEISATPYAPQMQEQRNGGLIPSADHQWPLTSIPADILAWIHGATFGATLADIPTDDPRWSERENGEVYGYETAQYLVFYYPAGGDAEFDMNHFAATADIRWLIDGGQRPTSQNIPVGENQKITYHDNGLAGVTCYIKKT